MAWVTTLREDQQGNIWIARDGYGLCKFDGKAFTFYTKSEGLPSNNVQSVEEGNNGEIWIGCRVTLSSMADHAPYKMMKLSKLCDAQQEEETSKNNSFEPQKRELEQENGPTLSVYPNPATDRARIKFEGGLAGNTTILINSIEGKEMLRKELSSNTENFNIDISLTDFSEGIYVVTILQANQVYSKSLIIK